VVFLDIPRDLPIVLATNNPKKATIFSENGFHLKGFEPIIVQPTVHTRHHLKAKQEQLEHILGLADAIGDTAGEPVSVSQPTLNSDVFRKIQSTCEQKNTILCCGKSNLGSAPHPWGAAQAGFRDLGTNRFSLGEAGDPQP
jgi:hypothetical protein